MFLSLTLSFSRSQTHTQTRAWPFPWSQLTFTQRRLWFFFRFLLPLSKIAFSIPIFSPLALIHPTLFALLRPPYLTIYVHILTSPASSLAPLLPLLPTTSLIPPSASTCLVHLLLYQSILGPIFHCYTPPSQYLLFTEFSKMLKIYVSLICTVPSLFYPLFLLPPTKGCPCTIPSLPSSIPQSLFSVCSRPVLTKSVSSQVSPLSILTSGLQNRDKHAHWDSCVLKHTDACIYKHAPESTHGSL